MASEPASATNNSDPGDAQERRAIDAITAIFAGGDLTDETLRLSNEFTDRHEARVRAWLIRKGRASR